MLRKLLVGSVLVAVAAACSDSTTGPENFDAPALQQKADQITAAFTNNAALLALSALTDVTAPFSAARTAVDLVPSAPMDRGTTTRLEGIAQSLLSFGSASPVALFPVDLLGKTFVYNTDSAKYIVDPQGTGAPTDGVRLILYAVDPVLHQPLLPLQSVGSLDLIDVSTASQDAVQIVATVGSVTYIDYTATAAVGTTSATLGAVGYVSNGTDRLDFNLSLGVTQASITVDYLLQAGGNSLRLLDVLSQTTETVTLTISDGTDTVVLSVTGTSNGWTGDIKINGAVAINISGTPNNPTFTKWDGTQLTSAEIAALVHVVTVIGDVFNTMDDLLGPALIVLALGNV
jgi:hypothetical protein